MVRCKECGRGSDTSESSDSPAGAGRFASQTKRSKPKPGATKIPREIFTDGPKYTPQGVDPRSRRESASAKLQPEGRAAKTASANLQPEGRAAKTGGRDGESGRAAKTGGPKAAPIMGITRLGSRGDGSDSGEGGRRARGRKKFPGGREPKKASGSDSGGAEPAESEEEADAPGGVKRRAAPTWDEASETIAASWIEETGRGGDEGDDAEDDWELPGAARQAKPPLRGAGKSQREKEKRRGPKGRETSSSGGSNRARRAKPKPATKPSPRTLGVPDVGPVAPARPALIPREFGAGPGRIFGGGGNL